MITITCWIGRTIWISTNGRTLATVSVSAIRAGGCVHLEIDAIPEIQVLPLEEAHRIIEERPFLPLPPTAA